MALIEFENYPSTDTAINASNLNNNFNELNALINNLSNKVDNELYYKSGDTYVLGRMIEAGGYLTGSAQSIRFSIAVPKRLDNISSVAINTLNVAIRKSNGGYLINGDVLTESNLTVTAYVCEPNYIDFYIANSGVYDGTNNTPIGVAINSLNMTFN